MNITRAILSMLLLVGLSQQVASASEWTESIKLNFGLDDKEWEVGWQNKTDDLYIIEFVKKGQDVEHWQELITFEFYPGLQKKINCSQFANGFIRHLKETEPKARVSSYLDKPDNVIIEWVLNGSTKNADQDELDRFIYGKQGLHVVHYVKKTKSLTVAERTKWMKFLESCTLTDGK